MPSMEESTAHGPAAAPRETLPVPSGFGPMPPGFRAPPRAAPGRIRASLGRAKQACTSLRSLKHRESMYIHGCNEDSDTDDNKKFRGGWDTVG